MSVTNKLARDSGTFLSNDDAFKYRIMVGGLQYLTLTRADISFAVNKKVAMGALVVRFISSNDQVADGFTKLATRNMLDRLRSNLNLVSVKIEVECKPKS
ncbi:hypothetical protein Tco_1262038 [Tanacetum coccineum]